MVGGNHSGEARGEGSEVDFLIESNHRVGGLIGVRWREGGAGPFDWLDGKSEAGRSGGTRGQGVGCRVSLLVCDDLKCDRAQALGRYHSTVTNSTKS